MPDRINTHDAFADGKCTRCGCAQSDKARSCEWHEPPPRAVPPRIFADLTVIGERAAQIRAEEAAARAGSGV